MELGAKEGTIQQLHDDVQSMGVAAEQKDVEIKQLREENEKLKVTISQKDAEITALKAAEARLSSELAAKVKGLSEYDAYRLQKDEEINRLT